MEEHELYFLVERDPDTGKLRVEVEHKDFGCSVGADSGGLRIALGNFLKRSAEVELPTEKDLDAAVTAVSDLIQLLKWSNTRELYDLICGDDKETKNWKGLKWGEPEQGALLAEEVLITPEMRARMKIEREEQKAEWERLWKRAAA